MQTPHVFTPLLVVVALALVVPLLLTRVRWLRLPIVVGEILAGIVVGRSGLNLVTHEDALLHVLSELGFVFLMFLSGMEVDFSSLSLQRTARGSEKAAPWGPLTLAGLTFLLTLSLSAAAGFAFWRIGLVGNPWMVGLILSTTSLGVVVPVLKEQGLAMSRYGQTLVVSALVADFVTMLLITIVVAALTGGAAARVLLIGVLCAMVFVVYRLSLAINRAAALRRLVRELSQATAQIKVRAAFALMLVFVALSEVMGTEVILGAFLAGSVVAALKTSEDQRFHDQLEGVGFGFFIPVFFIMVGVQFHLPSLFGLGETVWLLPLLLAAALLVKVVPGLLFRLAFGWREAAGAGVLLSARLSLIIAAAAIGRRIGAISEPVSAAIILVAIVTVTVAPPLFVHLVSGSGRRRTSRIVVSGAGELGLHVARELRGHLEDVVVVDPDPARVQRALALGLESVAGDMAANDPALSRCLTTARAVVCTDNDADRNLRVCQVARRTYGITNLVAEVSDVSELTKFEELGAKTMNAALDSAALLVMLVRNPAVYALLSRTDDDKEVYEFEVPAALAGARVADLPFPRDVLAVALRRSGHLLVPHGQTGLEVEDELTVIGSLEAIQAVRREIEQSSMAAR